MNRLKLAESVWLNSNRLGVRPLPRGTTGAIHVPKSRVTILSGEAHAKEVKPVVRAANFPPYFSWIDNRSLFQPEYPRFPIPSGYNYCDETKIPPLPSSDPKNIVSTFVLGPSNQGLCGNCYAVSSGNMTTARFSIWGLQAPKKLSYFQLTDCTMLALDPSIEAPCVVGGPKEALNQCSEMACGGGNPADCFEYMRKYGVLSDVDYQALMNKTGKYPGGSYQDVMWPSGQASYNEGAIKGDPEDLRVPPPSTCIAPDAKKYPYQVSSIIKGDKAVQLSTIESIKSELFNNGPIVSMFKVWDDFNVPSVGEMHLWPETNNIYVRGAYKVRSTMSCDDYIHKYNNCNQLLLNVNFKPEDIVTYKNTFGTQLKGSAYNPSEFDDIWRKFWASADQNMEQNYVAPNTIPTSGFAGHAVVIVGWGVDNNVPGYGTLEYWIVQNSWGQSWNDQGYFKIAMSMQKNKNGVYAPIQDLSRKGDTVNSDIGIDLMVGDNTDNYFGGVFAWSPVIIGKNGQPIDNPMMPVDSSGNPIPVVPIKNTCPPPMKVIPVDPPENCDPMNPNPGQPNQPNQPNQPIQPPAKPVQPAKPNDPLFPTLPFFNNQPGQPSIPVQPPVQPVQPPNQPIQPVQPPVRPPSSQPPSSQPPSVPDQNISLLSVFGWVGAILIIVFAVGMFITHFKSSQSSSTQLQSQFQSQSPSPLTSGSTMKKTVNSFSPTNGMTPTAPMPQV